MENLSKKGLCEICDVLVVDNASLNESFEELKKYEELHTWCTLIRANSNRGYAAGNNIGLRYACKKGYLYSWVMNNDIVIKTPQVLQSMLEGFQKNKNVACVSPEVLKPDGSVVNRNQYRPSFLDLTFGCLAFRKKGRSKIESGGQWSYVYRPQGCCMMVRNEWIRAVNYFDEHTFLYGEESILAERLLKKSFYCIGVFEYSVIHNHSTTVKDNIHQLKNMGIQLASMDYYLKEYRKFNWVQRWICKMFKIMRLILRR